MEYQLYGECGGEEGTFDFLGEKEATNNLSFDVKIVYSPGLLAGHTIVLLATLWYRSWQLIIELL